MKGFVIFGYEDGRGVHIQGSDLIQSWEMHFSSDPVYSLTREGPVRHVNPAMDLRVCMLNPKIVSGMPGEWNKTLFTLLTRWSPEPKEVPTQKELPHGH